MIHKNIVFIVMLTCNKKNVLFSFSKLTVNLNWNEINTSNHIGVRAPSDLGGGRGGGGLIAPPQNYTSVSNTHALKSQQKQKRSNSHVQLNYYHKLSIKETVNCSLYEKFRTILTVFKTAFFRAATKTKVLAGAHLGRSLLSSFCHCFLDGNNIHLVDFHDTHSIDIRVFQNRILPSPRPVRLCFLPAQTSPARHAPPLLNEARIRKIT